MRLLAPYVDTLHVLPAQLFAMCEQQPSHTSSTWSGHEGRKLLRLFREVFSGPFRPLGGTSQSLGGNAICDVVFRMTLDNQLQSLDTLLVTFASIDQLEEDDIGPSLQWNKLVSGRTVQRRLLSSG